METRIQFAQKEPEAFAALMDLSTYVQKSKLSNTVKELIKIRASQINGCAFCINMHTKDARKYGETEQRIYLLNAWRETSLFTEEERCILQMTEEITLISQHGLTEETYQKAKALFDENYILQVIMTIISINSWNRMSVALRTQPE